MRRLPVYLVIDTSESMAGPAIEAVRAGVADLFRFVRSDPSALETVYLSMITFASRARQDIPLSSVTAVQAPDCLVLGSGTSLGAALVLLEQCLAREFVKTTAEIKGDYKPLIFILTDGDPTDDWRAVAARIKTELSDRRATVVAVACGEDADISTLRCITDDVLHAPQLTPEAISSLFRYMSASVVTASQALGDKMPLQELTGDLVKKAPVESAMPPRRPGGRYAYVRARCVRDRRLYIMRYAAVPRSDSRGASGEIYVGVGAHVVERFDFESDQPDSGPAYAASQLRSSPPCPCCGGNYWCVCGCGKIHCAPNTTETTITLTCPWCGSASTYEFGESADFEIGGTLG